MKIGFDLTFLLPDAGGLETYSHQLIKAILERHPSHDALAFVTRKTRELLTWRLDRLQMVELPTPDIHSRLGWSVGQFVVLPYAAYRARVNVLHSLGNFAPVAAPMPRVVTVHDPPDFFRNAATPGQLVRFLTAGMVAVGARYADQVIADSNEMRRVLMSDRLARVGNRVDVVYPGIDVPEMGAHVAATRSSEHRHTVLYVGTHLPHKNLTSLLGALALIPVNERPLMIFVGNATDAGDLHQSVRGLGLAEDVRLYGRVSQESLEGFYQQADCLISVSTHEGFGLPIVEAMARAVPVICSSLPVFEEIAGSAAVFVDPHDTRAIADSMRTLLRDTASRERLRAQGAERAKQFTWSTAADRMIAIYRTAIERGRRHP